MGVTRGYTGEQAAGSCDRYHPSSRVVAHSLALALFPSPAQFFIRARGERGNEPTLSSPHEEKECLTAFVCFI